MLKRTKVALCLAAFAVGGCHAMAEDFSSSPLTLDDATAPTKTSVLNWAIDKAGLGGLQKDWGIQAGGYIEGSYTYNFADPASKVNAGRVFDFEHNVERLNQIALQFARPMTPDVIAADAKAGKWDWGFGVDQMWGSDGRLIHSNGLSAYRHFTHPINQYDFTQGYLDIVVPIGNGLDIRAGKFVTPFGEETIAPVSTVTGSSGNALYSHSFEFGFGIPFTQTGVIASYQVNDKWKVMGGMTRGWDQSTDDNNGSPDFLGQVVYTPNKEWSVTVNASIGPQAFRDTSDYRYVFEGIVAYNPANSRWTFAGDGEFAWQEHANAMRNTAYWYGFTGYAGYKVNDMWTVNGRAEWFRDDGGSRTGVNASFYEVTLGLSITPFPHDKILSNLILRPELRGDFSNKSAFNGGADKNQGTVAMDAIFAL